MTLYVPHRLAPDPYPRQLWPGWAQQTVPGWLARDGAGALYFGGKRWLFGGWSSIGALYNDVWCDDGTGWALVAAAAPWSERHSAAWTIHNGRMTMVGGDVVGGAYENEIYSTVNGVDWVRHQDMPAGLANRALHLGAELGGRLCISGGQAMTNEIPGPEALHNDTWSADDLGVFGGAAADWQCDLADGPASAHQWSARGVICGSAVVTVSGHERWYIYGGGTYTTALNPRSYTNEVWYTEDRATWNQVTVTQPFLARYYNFNIADGSRLWNLGGHSVPYGGNCKLADYSDDYGVTWTTYCPAWGARHAASAWHDGARLTIGAGTDGVGSLVDDWLALP